MIVQMFFSFVTNVIIRRIDSFTFKIYPHSQNSTKEGNNTPTLFRTFLNKSDIYILKLVMVIRIDRQINFVRKHGQSILKQA